MSDEATTTPLDKAHEAPIRDEIRRVNGSIDQLQRSIGPLFDALTDRMVRILRDEREQDAQRTAAAIAASEQRAMTHADDIHKSLELRVAAVENAIGEKDAIDVVLQDGLADVDKRAKKTDAEMRVFTRGRMGFGFASAALVLAGKSEITWDGVKVWAWSHGLLLTVAVAVLLVAAGVEIHTRARAQKGPPT